MKRFSDFLTERENINYNKKVQLDHSSYEKYSKSILVEMGVQSPTELNANEYEIYLSKLKDFNKGKTYTTQISETTKTPSVVLSDLQKQSIQNILDSAQTLQEAAGVVDGIFKKKRPVEYKGVKFGEQNGRNVLVLEFNDISYNFVKDSLLEKEIKSDEDFKKWLRKYLEEAHKDKFDEKIYNKMAEDLLKKKVGNDYGAIIGMAKKG